MANILIRADSSHTIGTGHIMRDLVLAQQFPRDTIMFATQSLAGNINSYIHDKGYQILTLSSPNTNELISLIHHYNIELLIIDHYDITYDDEYTIKHQTNIPLFVLDDTYQKHYCDILLNHNIYASSERYTSLVPPFCDCRCGEKFTLLRDEFFHAKATIEPQIYHIFLALGGSDPLALTLPIAHSIHQHYPHYIIHCATTSANHELTTLQNYAQSHPHFHLYINASHIASLMAQSSLAIVSASVLLNEIMFLNRPFIAIKTAQNQEEMVKFLHHSHLPCIENFSGDELHHYLKRFLTC